MSNPEAIGSVVSRMFNRAELTARLEENQCILRRLLALEVVQSRLAAEQRTDLIKKTEARIRELQRQLAQLEAA